MISDEDKKILYNSLDSHANELIQSSDYIWEAAELAFCENKSAARLCSILENNGFEVETNLAGIETAFLGKYGNGKPVIGFLGEFDALSNLSQESGVSFEKAVQAGGSGHGCGHNLLGTGSMAAAIALKEYIEKNGCNGTVVYFGCPGEEGGSGKAFMAKAGVFDNVDVALTWHPGDTNMVSSGSSLANVQVKYHFVGKSAHAAACPHLGRSALDAVELMDIGANYLREHIIQEARIHYAITNTGGAFPGVVQPDADVIYLIRAPKMEQVEEIYQRVNKIAQGAAMMTETHVDIDFIKACAEIVSNRTLEKVLYEAMLQTQLPEYTDEDVDFAEKISSTLDIKSNSLDEYISQMSGEERKKFIKSSKKSIYDFVMPYSHSEVAYSSSTDVGDVSHICPTGQIGAAAWAAGTPVHTWQATAQGKCNMAHKSIIYVGKILSTAAVMLIRNQKLIAMAKEEHKERTGEKFISLIPDGVKPRKMV